MFINVARQAHSEGPPIGPPQLTPQELAALPHDNLGPRLNAVIWTLTAVSAIFLALRLYCRIIMAKVLWWDDWFLSAAWIAIFVESIIVSVAIGMGFGRHSWDVPFDDLPALFKVFSPAGTLAVCASVWSKTSFALTILKLTTGWLRKLIWALIISMNVFMGVTALIHYIRCWPLEKLFDLTNTVPGTCWPIDVIIHYDIFSAVYSGAMDIVLALLPWKLIWNLQMQKKEKLAVAFAMSMGVFAGVTAFVKARYLWSMESLDIYDSVDLNYWSNAESTVTIMAASIPMLRVLVKDVKNNLFSPHRTDETSAGVASNPHNTRSRNGDNNVKVMFTVGTDRSRPGSQGTEGSELDILGREFSSSGQRGILQTSKYTVEYEEREGSPR